MEIIPIPCLTDNYAYLVREGDEAVIVDPSESAPVEATVAELGVRLVGILCTHHHPDHVGGVGGLLSTYGALPVIAHPRDASRIAAASRTVEDAEKFALGGVEFRAIHVPAHTLGALGYVANERAVFTGDTMFVAGCGRLFEGTPAMMHRALLLGFGRLADDVAVYPGHEYAEKNLRFAHEVEPGNGTVSAHLARVQERRRAGLFCVPSTIADEKATNPFLRVAAAEVRAFAKAHGGNANDPVDVLAAVRRARDEF
jgi:hydroxyacylglutathione hydrolase